MKASNSPKFSLLSKATVLAMIASLGLAAYVYAGNPHHRPAQEGPMLSGLTSPAALSAHLEGLLPHVDQVAKLSSEQKAQARILLAQTHTDLLHLQTRFQNTQLQIQTQLSQATINPQTIETLRQEQVSNSDSASKKVTQMMVALAQTLTPEQRQHFSPRNSQP